MTFFNVIDYYPTYYTDSVWSETDTERYISINCINILLHRGGLKPRAETFVLNTLQSNLNHYLNPYAPTSAEALIGSFLQFWIYSRSQVI